MIGVAIFAVGASCIRGALFRGGLPMWFGIRTNLVDVFADSAGCPLGRFSHWWRSVWVSVFGEGGFHTSVVLASTVLLGCQKHGNCTLGQLMSPRSESVFFASFLCRFGQRNDAPPRAVANSDKENSSLKQTAKAESSNPALTPTPNPATPSPPPAHPQVRTAPTTA